MTLQIGQPLAPTRPPARVDQVAPTATVRVASRVRARTMRARGVTVTLTCNELCRASFELKAVAATARTLERRRVSGARGVMARGALRLGGPPTRRLNLKLTADGRRALQPRSRGPLRAHREGQRLRRQRAHDHAHAALHALSLAVSRHRDGRLAAFRAATPAREAGRHGP